MHVISKKEIILTEKEIKEIISVHLRSKGYRVFENGVTFNIKTEDDKCTLKECTVEADIEYL